MNVITAQPNPQGISQADRINPTGDVKCQYCQREVRLIKEPKQEMAFWGGSILTAVPVCMYTCTTRMDSGFGVIDSMGSGIANGGIIGGGTGIMAAVITGCLVDRCLRDRKCLHVQDAPILNQPQAKNSALAEEHSSSDQPPYEADASVSFIENTENFRKRFNRVISGNH